MLVWLAAPANVAIDRAVNLALIVLAAATVYRVTTLARSGLLWRVSRKLILSYILVGAVPILLLVTFSLLAFLLVFFDISSYLVHDRVAHLTEQASVFGRTTLFEIERAAPSEHADIIQRRQSAIASRYPGVSIALVPEDQLPKWVSRAGFTGLVDRGTIARAVLFPRGSGPRDAVVVDLPVDSTMDEAALAEAGITLGERRRRSLFNTATSLTYVDWETGAPERDAHRHERRHPDAVQLDGGNRSGEANLNFNRILLYMLVGIGVLLLVIEVVALEQRSRAGAHHHDVGRRAVQRHRARQERKLRTAHHRAIGRPARAACGLVQRHDRPHPAPARSSRTRSGGSSRSCRSRATFRCRCCRRAR